MSFNLVEASPQPIPSQAQGKTSKPASRVDKVTRLLVVTRSAAPLPDLDIRNGWSTVIGMYLLVLVAWLVHRTLDTTQQSVNHWTQASVPHWQVKVLEGLDSERVRALLDEVVAGVDALQELSQTSG
ncbi:MAG: hypothetical protein ACREQ3_17300, partial [Candidatus Binatia bacterium]